MLYFLFSLCTLMKPLVNLVYVYHSVLLGLYDLDS